MSKHHREATRDREVEAAEPEAATQAAADGTAPAEDVDAAEMLEEDLTALMQRLQEQEQLAAESHDKFLRTLAEFENYRRRTKQEVEDARRSGTERLAAD